MPFIKWKIDNVFHKKWLRDWRRNASLHCILYNDSKNVQSTENYYVYAYVCNVLPLFFFPSLILSLYLKSFHFCCIVFHFFIPCFRSQFFFSKAQCFWMRNCSLYLSFLIFPFAFVPLFHAFIIFHNNSSVCMAVVCRSMQRVQCSWNGDAQFCTNKMFAHDKTTQCIVRTKTILTKSSTWSGIQSVICIKETALGSRKKLFADWDCRLRHRN